MDDKVVTVKRRGDVEEGSKTEVLAGTRRASWRCSSARRCVTMVRMSGGLGDKSNQRKGGEEIEEASVITAPWRRDHNAVLLQSINFNNVKRKFRKFLKKFESIIGDPRYLSLNAVADEGLLEGGT
ncbi:unnamed protein product [Arabidopsis halleri]